MTAHNSHYRFIQPLDALILRGNKLFGDAGSYGEALMPPWPSVAAGALRSRMLVDDKVDLQAFAAGDVPHPVLGTPKQPGAFALTHFSLGRLVHDNDMVYAEPVFAVPADVIVCAEEEEKQPDTTTLHLYPLRPRSLHSNGLLSSSPLPQQPVLAQQQRSKPQSGYWLTAERYRQYLRGELPATLTIAQQGRAHSPQQQRQARMQTGLLRTADLWRSDHRVGVALDEATRSAKDQHLFSLQAIQMHPDMGFVVGAYTGEHTGEQSTLPKDGSLRLGGDGRAASIVAAQIRQLPERDADTYADIAQTIAQTGKARLVLTSPGIFANGWLPGATGTTGAGNSAQQAEDGSCQLRLHGITARIVAAALPRHGVVSGWDLAAWQPKAAERAVPAGTVYWLEDIQLEDTQLENTQTTDSEQATPAALQTQLQQFVHHGLWSSSDSNPRRAEGFNRCLWAVWQ